MKALAALPGYPRAMAALARVHLQRKDGSEAVRWAERLVAKQPNRGNNQLLLGDAWALRGDKARARAAWHRAASYGNATARKRLR
jgi:predicted negative regulator of RcsB-dependent stress response